MDDVGIDLHKKESQICILGGGGEVSERRIRTEPQRFAEGKRRNDKGPPLRPTGIAGATAGVLPLPTSGLWLVRSIARCYRGVLGPGHGEAPAWLHHADHRIGRARAPPPEPPGGHRLVPLDRHLQEGLRGAGAHYRELEAALRAFAALLARSARGFPSRAKFAQTRVTKCGM